MKSSLPQILRKDISQLSIPQRQSPEYSLFLRTNNFTLKTNNQLNSTRYNNGSTQRVNKSMDGFVNQRKTFSLSKQLQNQQNGLKSLLTQRKKGHSRSFFIEQKQSQTAEQIDSFKTVRKRVLQEVSLIEKSLSILSKTQRSIKQGLTSIKQTYQQDLNEFEQYMKRQINELRNNFKALRKQANVEIKVNKQQAIFLSQQASNLKQIINGFQQQTVKLRYQIMNDTSSLVQNK